MDERNINQNLIDLFKEKASKQPNEIFVISTFINYNSYRILNNFYIYLTMSTIENGVINHNRKCVN